MIILPNLNRITTPFSIKRNLYFFVCWFCLTYLVRQLWNSLTALARYLGSVRLCMRVDLVYWVYDVDGVCLKACVGVAQLYLGVIVGLMYHNLRAFISLMQFCLSFFLYLYQFNLLRPLVSHFHLRFLCLSSHYVTKLHCVWASPLITQSNPSRLRTNKLLLYSLIFSPLFLPFHHQSLCI